MRTLAANLSFGTLLCLSLAGMEGVKAQPFEAPTDATWDRLLLGSYVSDAYEPLPAFLKRLGVVLARHTQATGHEACGVIGRNTQGQHGVTLFTDSVQRGCSMRWSEVSSGFVATGETIHSHPTASELRLTERDLAWNRAHGEVLRSRTLVVKPGFSAGDFRAGPGWLVQGRDLYYQNGRTRLERHMGRIGRMEGAPQAKPDSVTMHDDAMGTP